MKAYPAYKESNVEWFGTIPSHWGTVPLKYVCYMKGRIGWQGLTQSEFIDEGPYLITGMNFKNGTMNWDECYHISKERYVEAPEIHVREGDVLITKDGTIGKLLFMDHLPGPTSLNSHLLILRPRNDEFTPKYLYYLLHSDAFLRFVDNVKTGTTFYGITQASMGDFRMLIFDKAEQQAIADFLDCKTVQIDTLIEKKQRQIDLLQEQRTALINHAVTKGLNPKVPMKDSGVEWLGQIPSHWEVEELRRHWKIIDCKHRTATYVDGEGIPIVSTTEIKPGRLSLEKTRLTTREDYLDLAEGERRPKRGDIIYSRNASLGSAAFVDTDQEFCMGQDVCLITSDNQSQLFLSYQVNNPLVLRQLESMVVGATFKRINIGQILLFAVLRPPVEEQVEIARYLDLMTTKIDNLI